MNDLVACNRRHLAFERIHVDGRACPLDESCDAARLADQLHVTDELRQRMLRRRKVSDRVSGQDRRRIENAELRLYRIFELLRR